MVGLSREFAVLSRQEAKLPQVEVQEGSEKIDGKLKVTIDDSELCARYAARMLYTSRWASRRFGCSNGCVKPEFVLLTMLST